MATREIQVPGAKPLITVLLYFISILTGLSVEISARCTRNRHCLGHVCDDTTGNCLYGCLDGWTGTDCDTLAACPRCKYSHCDAKNICKSGCVSGYYGDTCNWTCSKTCLRSCDSKSGVCFSGCKHGWYGRHCVAKCGTGCVNKRCHRMNGRCQCLSGWWGPTCNKTCESCDGMGCDSVTGKCVNGCAMGSNGPECLQIMCRMCLKNTCHMSDKGIICSNCIRGANCELKCLHNCSLCPENDSQCFKRIHAPKISISKREVFKRFVKRDVQITTKLKPNSPVTGEITTYSAVNTSTSTTKSNGGYPLGKAPGSEFNLKTKIYICSWILVMVFFIVLFLVWCGFQIWQKHKIETDLYTRASLCAGAWQTIPGDDKMAALHRVDEAIYTEVGDEQETEA